MELEQEHFENQEHEWESNLKVTGVDEQPVQVNPMALERLRARQIKIQPLEYYINGIDRGDRVILSQAITLVESALPKHQQMAQQIIAACLPKSGNALRLGITGVPGAGKSTFIEALGMHLCKQGKKIAVLAIDPSSQRSKGSILGDKTRMEQLSTHPNAFSLGRNAWRCGTKDKRDDNTLRGSWLRQYLCRDGGCGTVGDGSALNGRFLPPCADKRCRR